MLERYCEVLRQQRALLLRDYSGVLFPGLWVSCLFDLRELLANLIRIRAVGGVFQLLAQAGRRRGEILLLRLQNAE